MVIGFHIFVLSATATLSENNVVLEVSYTQNNTQRTHKKDVIMCHHYSLYYLSLVLIPIYLDLDG